MAHSLQAKKRIRQTATRTAVNRRRRGDIRTHIRRVEEAIASGDQEAAMKAFREAQPKMMAGVNKGVMEKNTVSRKLSRLSKRIKAMAA
ncbi:MAG: 30S ribosomal protein S20 [Magnetovibrio sp.]|nr:30S ribosomal protein S20 [Magnetovibrio sp.]